MQFEDAPEEIGTFATEPVGDTLRASITERWPTTTIEVVPVTREGATMYGMVVKTDPLTVSEMRAFVSGFFLALNNKHRL